MVWLHLGLYQWEQRSCADVISLYKRRSELTQRALYINNYSETRTSTGYVCITLKLKRISAFEMKVEL